MRIWRTTVWALTLLLSAGCVQPSQPTNADVNGPYSFGELQSMCATFDEPLDRRSRYEIEASRACGAYISGYYQGYADAQSQTYGSSSCTETYSANDVIRRFRNVTGHSPNQPVEPILRMIADESVNCTGAETAVPAPTPADYEHVRAMILNAFRTGASLDDPRIDVWLARLSDEDKTRLMQDPEINAALATGQ
jgi:hypothetical protein